MEKHDMCVSIPVTDAQIERLEKLLPRVKDEICKQYEDFFGSMDKFEPSCMDMFDYIVAKESNSFVVGILVNILISNEEKDQARAAHE